MKRFYTITLLAVLSLGCLVSMAQEQMVVEPGVGTLNEAVAANGGDKVYVLTAGEWYGLNAPIENVDYHLQIIGSEPAEEGGMPATLQTGSDAAGAPLNKMFDAKGDITLKNIYFVNADLNAQVADQFLVQSKNDARVTIDGSVIHPACVAAGINGQGGNVKTYFTNNQVIGFGHQLNPNDGHFFSFANASGMGLDTLFIENNTFVCMGMNMFSGNFAADVHNYVNWNHNTFVMTKSQIDWATFKKEQYWTNNLMFDVQTQPYMNNWQPMPGGDASMPKPNLIYADTLAGESLPTNRPNFVQYNSHYRAQGFYDLLDEINVFAAEKGLPAAYLFDLTWPADTVNSREAQMFNSTDFPEFKYGNTIKNVDPKWNDAKIYEHEARFVEWTKPATYIHGLGQDAANYPAPTEWAQWWWIPSGDLSNNSAWPVFDGTYTDEATLTGSIEKNIPLGDLNWFPEAKAIWAEHKAEIEAHIKSGNTGQIDIGAFKVGTNEMKSKGFKMYPNPAQNILNIRAGEEAVINIISIDGRTVKSVIGVSTMDISDLSNGVYIVNVKDAALQSTQKLVIKR